jgi:hypothetical protein
LASPDLSATASERSEGSTSVIHGAIDYGVVATIPNILHISVPPLAGHPRPPCVQDTSGAPQRNCECYWCLTPTVFTIGAGSADGSRTQSRAQARWRPCDRRRFLLGLKGKPPGLFVKSRRKGVAPRETARVAALSADTVSPACALSCQQVRGAESFSAPMPLCRSGAPRYRCRERGPDPPGPHT